ncbi:MAG: hypothetical protein AAF437_00675 [Pseudomonadota bacterium]
MTDDSQSEMSVDAMEAIDGFLEALRRELHSNPELTYRVLKALPTQVHFLTQDAVKFVNPIELIADQPKEVALERLDGFTPAELKKMAQGANLASSTDLKGLTKDQILDMMISRAQAKINERRL